MYLIDLIRGFNEKECRDFIEFEYRLICSGEIYNAAVQTFDHRKSAACRLLLNKPFALFVCSEWNQYPAELCLRFCVPLVTESHNLSTLSYHPDEEIAKDVSAILTLYLRRLVTVSCKTREDRKENELNYPDIMQKWPVGISSTLKTVAWKRKPAVLHLKPEGRKIVPEVIDYNPRPLGVKPEELTVFLNKLCTCTYLEQFLLASRLYALALQKIDDEIDISYALLVPCIESLASSFSKSYRPTDEEKIETQNEVRKKALGFGLSVAQANQLAILASKRERWIAKKFVNFIKDFCPESIWEEDELFKPDSSFLPSRDDFEKTLKTIYNSRSEFQHQGLPFPETATICGPTISVKASHAFLSGQKFPPVYWFERVVNLTMKNFLLNA